MSQDRPEISLIGMDLDPMLIEKARERNPRPDHLTFECLNFLSEEGPGEILRKYLARLNKTRFDVVFCFSITMWVHLNHGDEGLEEFLRKACDLAEMIVIEPQPWRCYRKAARRLRRAGLEDFPLLNKLKYTGDMIKHIGNILTRLCGFQKVTISAGNKWGRMVLIYERKQQS
jgi:SAM-dependent methyltransferase